MIKNHPFHLVTNRPWPLILSFNLINLLNRIIILFYFNNIIILLLSIPPTLLTLYQWWRDIIRERTFQGIHTFYVLNLIKFGIILFIISELIFFISFFWTFFHRSISPNIDTGNIWPPKNIYPLNPYNIPLLNSIILISSGFTITWCHNSILKNNLSESKISLTLTICLGIYFSLLQIFEYYQTNFCYNDRIYRSIFFLTTGFHGTHVNIGITFLTICLIRLLLNHYSKIHHFNFESAAWYWHFVDIIWLFVYSSIYWWIY